MPRSAPSWRAAPSQRRARSLAVSGGLPGMGDTLMSGANSGDVGAAATVSCRRGSPLRGCRARRLRQPGGLVGATTRGFAVVTRASGQRIGGQSPHSSYCLRRQSGRLSLGSPWILCCCIETTPFLYSDWLSAPDRSRDPRERAHGPASSSSPSRALPRPEGPLSDGKNVQPAPPPRVRAESGLRARTQRRGTNAVTGPRPDRAYRRAWRFPRRALRGASPGNLRPTRTLRQQHEGGCGRQRPRSREPLSVQS